MLEWTAEYSTGQPEIDSQHRKLFATVNELERELHSEGLEEILPLTLAFLKTYVRSHFVYEERCFLAHKCPYADQNKQAHQQLIQALPAFEGRLEREGPTPALAQELHRTLEGWLRDHVLKVDTHLKACIKSA